MGARRGGERSRTGAAAFESREPGRGPPIALLQAARFGSKQLSSEGDTWRTSPQTRPWRQRSQPLHEFQRQHYRVRGAVAPDCLPLEHRLLGGVAPHPLLVRRPASDAAAQLLEPFAARRITSHGGVQIETLHGGAQVFWSEGRPLGTAPRSVSTFWPARGSKGAGVNTAEQAPPLTCGWCRTGGCIKCCAGPSVAAGVVHDAPAHGPDTRVAHGPPARR